MENAPSTPVAKIQLREACQACAVSKVRCSKAKPTCERCDTRGTACEYLPTSRRRGRSSQGEYTDAIVRKLELSRLDSNEGNIANDSQPKREASPPEPPVKKLQLSRPLAVIDVETTGLDVRLDRIVEISCVKIHPDGEREILTHRVHPERPIPPAATAVHSIYDSDVASCATFKELAPELLEFLRDCDVSGFNVERFDLPLLTAEFERAGITFPTEPVQVIDSLRIYMHYERRDLSSTFRFYCNDELQGAHGAEADANAAADILIAQVHRYNAQLADLASLSQAASARSGERIDPDGKIIWRENQAVLSFGKHRHKSLQQLSEDEDDRGYLVWMLQGSFSQSVKSIVRAALDGNFRTAPPVL